MPSNSMALIKNEAIIAVEEIIGYSFNDANCLWEALQAPGSGVFQAGHRAIPEGNKRLALVGDAAIKKIIVDDWFLTDHPRGNMAPT